MTKINRPRPVPAPSTCPECQGRRWIYGDPRPVCMYRSGSLRSKAAILLALSLLLTACNPFPGQPATPDEPPALACPCPDFAIQDHPEDPNEAPGTWCLARSRTGQWMDAREHPRCQREARERKERRP